MRILTLLIFFPAVANASLEWQMQKIRGDWDAGRDSRKIYRIQKQTVKSIKVFSCDRNRYLAQDGFCHYDSIRTYRYNRYLDAFYDTMEWSSCTVATSLQVSIEYPNQALKENNPFALPGGCHFRNPIRQLEKLPLDCNGMEDVGPCRELD